MNERPTGPIGGPAAWAGPELDADERWLFRLDGADLLELDDALAQARASGKDWQALTRDDFPLRGLAGRLAAVADSLENDRGIAILRGLPVARYDETDLRRLFWGIGLHLGTPVCQSAKGEWMAAITDEGAARASYGVLDGAGGTFLSSKARTRSTGLLRFHTDRTDVVALLCVRQAATGGVSRVASAVAVHDEILRRRPDLWAVLFEDFPRTRFGEESPDNAAWYALPVFGWRDGRFTTHYSRTYIEAVAHCPGAPQVTAEQEAAMDLLAEVCDELCHEHRMEPGDIQLLNSHVTYHARTAYDDDAGAERLLLRLWLSMANSRALPKGHEVLWGRIAAGALRGGVWAEGMRP